MIDKWSTVMANCRLRAGGYSADSLCYVSFGFGLKPALCKGDIVLTLTLTLTLTPNALCYISFGFGLTPSLCKGDIVQNPTGNVARVSLGASEDAERLALMLFQNVTLFSKNTFVKSHLRNPEFYKDILKLEKPPGNRKCTQIFDAFKVIETAGRNY